MSSNELLDLFAEALEVEASMLPLDAAIADIPEWNSLAWLTIMSLIDERYSVQLNSKEIRSFVTVKDVVDAISAKAALAQ